MLPARIAEATKLAASTATAYGAVIAPIAGRRGRDRAIWAPERLSSSFELPSTSCSLRTSEGRYDWYATSKKTVSVPVANPTTYSCQMVTCPSAAASGTEPSAQGAADVGGDEDRPACEPVDPDAGGEREEEERQHLDRAEQRDLNARRLERDDRDERQREAARPATRAG